MSIFALSRLIKEANTTDTQRAVKARKLRAAGRFWKAAALEDEDVRRAMAYSPLLTKALIWAFEKPYEEREEWSRFGYALNKFVQVIDASARNDEELNECIKLYNQGMKTFLLFTPFKNPTTDEEKSARLALEYWAIEAFGRIQFLQAIDQVYRESNNGPIYTNIDECFKSLLPFPSKKITWGHRFIGSARRLKEFFEGQLKQEPRNEVYALGIQNTEAYINKILGETPNYLQNEQNVLSWMNTFNNTHEAQNDAFSDGAALGRWLGAGG